MRHPQKQKIMFKKRKRKCVFFFFFTNRYLVMFTFFGYRALRGVYIRKTISWMVLSLFFFFFYLIFFSSLFIWESLERCWLFCRYIFLIAPIVGDGGRTSAIFEKKKERNGRSFHSKELISRLHGAARQTLKYLSFLYKWFLSIVGPRWHFFLALRSLV